MADQPQMVLELLKAITLRLPHVQASTRMAPTMEEAYRLTEEKRAQYRGDTRAPDEAT